MMAANAPFGREAGTPPQSPHSKPRSHSLPYVCRPTYPLTPHAETDMQKTLNTLTLLAYLNLLGVTLILIMRLAPLAL